MGSPELAEDEGLSITQVLDTYTDENGSVMEDVVTTGLLVLDENNNLVRADSIKTGSAGLSEYSIYSTMNASETNDTTEGRVRFNWFDTKLIYGTAMTAGSLRQESTYSPEPFFIYEDITKSISYPQGNVSYRYTPANKDMVTYMKAFCGRICRSIISAGSRSFILGYTVVDGATGYWTTQYN